MNNAEQYHSPGGVTDEGHAPHNAPWSVVLRDRVRLDLDDLSSRNFVPSTLADGVLEKFSRHMGGSC